MDLNLKDKVALVTGSTRGIGRAIAIALAKEGANVVVNYSKDEAAATETAKILKKENCRFVFCKADISKLEEVESMIQSVRSELGKLDILVNNAGIIRDGSVSKMDYQAWNDVMQTNLAGAFNCVKCCLPLLLKETPASIINISSIIGIAGNFGQINYATSKAGIIGLTKSLAKELGRKGVRVNAIAPGFVDTCMLSTVPEEIKSEYLRRIPLMRFARPEEIADLACFLSSDKSSYIHGQVIVADGGYY